MAASASGKQSDFRSDNRSSILRAATKSFGLDSYMVMNSALNRDNGVRVAAGPPEFFTSRTMVVPTAVNRIIVVRIHASEPG